MVALVASAVRLRWLGVTGVWCICEFKIDKGGERGKVRDELGAFWQAEGGSVVGLVASAVRLRWLGVIGVWCICECKIDKGVRGVKSETIWGLFGKLKGVRWWDW